MIDPIDIRIIAAYQSDGRATYEEIGREVGLSAPSVYQRTRKLVASGAIAGFRARVDPAQVGYPVLAFVRVELGAEADADQLLAQWAATPECEACYALGDADGFLLRYRLPSMEALGPHLRTMRLRGARPHADLTIRTIFERDVTPRAGA